MSELIQMFQDGDYLSLMIVIMSKAFVVFCCLPIHELAHAIVANKCGDDTARLQGRLTLNPFAHLDFVGTVMIFFFGIGYAKPGYGTYLCCRSYIKFFNELYFNIYLLCSFCFRRRKCRSQCSSKLFLLCRNGKCFACSI